MLWSALMSAGYEGRMEIAGLLAYNDGDLSIIIEPSDDGPIKE